MIHKLPKLKFIDSTNLFIVQLRHFTKFDLNISIKTLAKRKANPHELLALFNKKKEEGFEYNRRTYLLAQSAQIQIHCQNKRISSAKKIWNELINDKSYQNELDQGDCALIITTFVKHNYPQTALEIFHETIEHNIKPYRSHYEGIYHAAISAAGKLKSSQQAIQVHNILLNKHPELIDIDEHFQHNLLNMYLKCGDMENAMKIFQSNDNKRNVNTWTILINAMIDDNKYQYASELFEQMIAENIKPNQFTYSSMSKAIAKQKCLDKAHKIYERIMNDTNIANQLYENVVFVTSIISMFSKCGDIDKANKIWNHLLENKPNVPNIKSWNAIINVNFHNENYQNVLDLYDQLVNVRENADITTQHTLIPNIKTYVVCIRACRKLKNLRKGQEIHKSMKRDVTININKVMDVQSALLNMYIECSNLKDGISIWMQMIKKHTVDTYTLLINTCINCGDNLIAFELFDKMQNVDNIKPDTTCYLTILKACDRTILVDEIYKDILSVDSEFINNELIVTALVNAYNKCGDTLKANQISANLLHIDPIDQITSK